MANYLNIRALVPPNVLLVVVSKGQSYEDILQCYNAGARDFGENRLEEFLIKKEALPKDIRWHMIGSIQSKKVPKVVGQFELIHSVDSLELAQKIDSKGVPTKILLEANTSGEASKHGLTPEEWIGCYDQIKILKNVSVEGLMTMAPFTDDEEVVRSCFKNLRKLREVLSSKGKPLPHLSMGMSHDWEIALQEGATILRIGTSIFKTNIV